MLDLRLINEDIVRVYEDNYENKYVWVRDLWESLDKPHSRSNKYIENIIIRNDFLIENVDYFYYGLRTIQTKGGPQNIMDALLTLNAALSISLKTRHKPVSVDVSNKLSQWGNMAIVARENIRKELHFLDTLEEVLKPMDFTLERQKNILSYRIDGYIGELKLAIEFDEYHHFNSTNMAKDTERQSEIVDELGCTFVRCSIKDSDNYNIGIVMKAIMGLQK